jgi:pilus assembly protein CpaF
MSLIKPRTHRIQTGRHICRLHEPNRDALARYARFIRHRPDRIIVGDVRGGEAYDLLQALNTGHAGTLSTIHANSAEQALARLSSCVAQAQVGSNRRHDVDRDRYETDELI